MPNADWYKRLTLSKGQVNIYTLPKTAGTSVYQIDVMTQRYLHKSRC